MNSKILLHVNLQHTTAMQRERIILSKVCVRLILHHFLEIYLGILKEATFVAPKTILLN
jgi:hypothetical protein